MIRVLIADDHSLVRQGLRTFLMLDSEIEVVGTAVDGAEAVKLAHQYQPDLVLMDLMMPVMNGFEATTIIKRELPNIVVLILTSLLDATTIARAVQAGAVGYLLKDIEVQELCRAIKSAAPRQVLLSAQAAELLVTTVRIASTPPPNLLTERETDVLCLLAQGKTNKEIAYGLQLSEKTVKIHVSIILSKLGMQSRTQAALHATRLGLVPYSYNETGSESVATL